MAFVRKKKKKNQDYFYIVESYRDGASVKQRILEYIGTLENLMKLAMKGWENNKKDDSVQDDELSFKSYLHGSCMALWWTSQLIGIESILDHAFPAKSVKGMKRSKVLLLAMIHRAIDPESKRAFSSWASQTSLPYYLQFKAEDITSQAFWEAMDGISESDIRRASNMLVERVIKLTGINPKSFHLDYTNYYTFIDSKNGRCIICKRGHNKQKRDDLRQFSLAVLTSYALQVPLVWELYEGNKNDKLEFPDFVKMVTEELKSHGIDPCEAIVSFDGGSNSEENFKDLEFNFICSSSLSENKHLYDIDIAEYQSVQLENDHVRLAYRVNSLEFCGITGTGILTYSKDLEEGQVAELEKSIQKTKELCEELNERLRNPASRLYTELRKKKAETDRAIKEVIEYNEELRKQQKEKGKTKKKEKAIPIWDEHQVLVGILEGKIYRNNKKLKEFTTLELYIENDKYQLRWVIDEKLKGAYIRKYFGKKLTCTNMSNLSTEKILEEYSEQECIETNIFKVSKDNDHFSVRPQYHWTDDKIRVHTFLCLTAITIAEILRLRYENEGIKLTKAAMINKLSRIHDGWIFKNEKTVVRTIEKMDEESKRLWAVIETLKKEIRV